MSNQKQIEEMAKIDGYKADRRLGLWGRGEGSYFILNRIPFSELPEYPTSLDACRRVILGMSEVESREYFHALLEITSELNVPWFVSYNKATAAQVTEAILKAHGVWADELDDLIASEEYLNEEG